MSLITGIIVGIIFGLIVAGIIVICAAVWIAFDFYSNFG